MKTKLSIVLLLISIACGCGKREPATTSAPAEKKANVDQSSRGEEKVVAALPAVAPNQPEGAIAQSQPAHAAPPEVPKVDPVLRRKKLALADAYEESLTSKVPAKIYELHNEIMELSRAVLIANADQQDVWLVRAQTALNVNDEVAAWECGKNMVRLGMDSSPDELVQKTLARLERKKLMGATRPARSEDLGSTWGGTWAADVTMTPPRHDVKSDWTKYYGNGYDRKLIEIVIEEGAPQVKSLLFLNGNSRQVINDAGDDNKSDWEYRYVYPGTGSYTKKNRYYMGKQEESSNSPLSVAVEECSFIYDGKVLQIFLRVDSRIRKYFLVKDDSDPQRLVLFYEFVSRSKIAQNNLDSIVDHRPPENSSSSPDVAYVTRSTRAIKRAQFELVAP